MPADKEKVKGKGGGTAATAATPGQVILDFSQVKPFEPLNSAQVYLCRVTGNALGRSKEGGPKTSVELTIEGPEMVQVEEWLPDENADGGLKKGRGLVIDEKTNKPSMTKAKGRKLFREYSLQSQALPFLYEFIKAINPESEMGEGFRFVPENYMGFQVAVKIQNEAFEEQVRARVKKVLPASAYKG